MQGADFSFIVEYL